MKLARFSGLAAFALSILMVGSASYAGADPSLATLVGPPGQSLTSGGLTYSNFTYVPSVDATPASAISVIASGNQLNIGGAFVATPGQVNDSFITFNVSSTSTISSVSLSAVLSATPPGFASVSETIYTDSTKTHELATLFVYTGGPQSVTATFAGVSSIYVEKDIAYTALSGGVAAISGITQTFGTAVVPEPASVVMMGLGLVGAIGGVRLRRKTVVA